VDTHVRQPARGGGSGEAAAARLHASRDGCSGIGGTVAETRGGK